MARRKQDVPEIDRTKKVVNHIRLLIEKGALQPGDRIPPERDLAHTLKISRASLRTGIGYLAAMGVMKVRHGVGTFIEDGPCRVQPGLPGPDGGALRISFLADVRGAPDY